MSDCLSNNECCEVLKTCSQLRTYNSEEIQSLPALLEFTEPCRFPDYMKLQIFRQGCFNSNLISVLCNSIGNIEQLEKEIDALKDRIKDLEDRMDDVEERLDVIELRLTVIENKIIQIENKIVQIETRLDGIDLKITNLTNRLTTLETKVTNLTTRVTNLENQINIINTRLDDLESQIEGMLGLNLVNLVKGTDYDLTFYNGWYASDINVRLSLAKTTASIMLSCSASDPVTQLKNNNLVDTRFAHGATVGSEEWNKARIFKITFKGKYAVLNSTAKYNTSSRGIMNVKPNSARASWDCVYTSFPDSGGQVLLMTSYADGYNNQFSTYGNPDLYTEGTNMSYNWTSKATIPT